MFSAATESPRTAIATRRAAWGRLSPRTWGRAAVASVWLYHGLWNKLLAGSASHAAVVGEVPGLGGPASCVALAAIGIFEVCLAAWVLTKRTPRAAAWVQTAALVAMNAGGLLWARHAIADPGAMLAQNAAFVALIWLLAEEDRDDRRAHR